MIKISRHSSDSSLDSHKSEPQIKTITFSQASRSPSPQIEKNFTTNTRQRILQSISYHPKSTSKPLSLSELVENLDTEQTPHSHKLIERFETMIQEKQKRELASKVH
jgi:hypothetical protein